MDSIFFAAPAFCAGVSVRYVVSAHLYRRLALIPCRRPWSFPLDRHKQAAWVVDKAFYRSASSAASFTPLR
jgi:hypothetical protein